MNAQHVLTHDELAALYVQMRDRGDYYQGQMVKVQEQRDELLAALRVMLDAFSDADDQSVIAVARAAIAHVGGAR